MYKIIKHDITEEHYDQPAMLPPQVKSMLTGQSGEIGSYVINENTLVFRMDSRTLWTRYSLGLINFSVAIDGEIHSSPLVEIRLYNIALNLGNYFGPYYGISSAYTIGQLFITYAKIATDFVRAIYAGESLDQFNARWVTTVDEISTYLNSLNPNYWPKPLLVDRFTQLYKTWTDNIVARHSKDIAQDTVSLDAIIKVAVSGIPDHQQSNYLSIADLISRGIVMQFPVLFTS